MSNDACDKILSFMQSQANGRINIPVRTRSIADAAGLTIYQARAYLVTLEGAGVVEKMNAGKGVSGRWRLVWRISGKTGVWREQVAGTDIVVTD